MTEPIRTNDPASVAAEVERAYRELFPEGNATFVGEAFVWALSCFAGQYKDYQPIDARYHDLEHTMQGTLCMTRLLRGRARAGAEPPLDEATFRLAILAMLLHDTGYLKRHDDRQGTGAKYTITHVSRSAAFAEELLSEKGYGPPEIQAVQNMIRCTGVDTVPRSIPFQCEPERIAGYALATADLLGQMAAEDYVDKLPILFSEFCEAVSFSGDNSHFIARFRSAEELLKRTPAFWERVVMPKLEVELGALYRFLNDPFPDGPNAYVAQVQLNMQRIRKPVASGPGAVRINDAD